MANISVCTVEDLPGIETVEIIIYCIDFPPKSMLLPGFLKQKSIFFIAYIVRFFIEEIRPRIIKTTN